MADEAAWLGVELDPAANDPGGPRISADGSRVSVWVIPTNEELMIARHTQRVLLQGSISTTFAACTIEIGELVARSRVGGELAREQPRRFATSICVRSSASCGTA